MSNLGDPSSLAGLSAPRRSRWGAIWRAAFEFALLFGIAIAAKQLLPATGPYPNPLWLPVIVLSLERGLAAGLTAAVIAAALQYWGGLPPALMTEDLYAYVGRVAAEPVGWTCVALLIGHIRSRQMAQTRALEAELVERIRHGSVIAELCGDLRQRAEMLERHIAAEASASNVEVAESVIALRQATWEDFAERLKRFVMVMAGTAEFSVYARQDDALKLVFQPGDEHRPASERLVMSDDPLFAAIVNEHRVLAASRSADAAILDQRGILAAPLLEGQTRDRVIGMFVLGGDAAEHHLVDIERRVALACSELSRLLGRINLIDRWQTAADAGPDASGASATPAKSNGGDASARGKRRGKRAAATARPAGGSAGDDPEMTVP